MSLSDADIELLESHLDGELSDKEEAALRHRLLSDRAMSLELETIRADRAMRVQAFASFEPSSLAVKRLVTGVSKQITRENVRETVRGDRLRMLRYVGSAAACILFSFSAGWLGKSHVAAQNPGADPSSALTRNDVRPDSTGDSNSNRVNDAGSGGYPVAITDGMGHIVAVQPFRSLKDAQEFSEDVGRLQRQQQQPAVTETVLYKDQF